MATPTFTIKRGDRLPYISASLSNGDSPADISGATEVFFVMKKAGGSKEVVIKKPAVVSDGAAGEVRYEWEAGDTDVSGRYTGEFEVCYGTVRATYPSNGYVIINIIADIG